MQLPAPEWYALFEDLSGIELAGADKPYWLLIKQCAHGSTKSLYSDEIRIHHSYSAYFNKFREAPLTRNGWCFNCAAETDRWYSETNYIFHDPKKEIRRLSHTEVVALTSFTKPEELPWPVYNIALGIKFLRTICDLEDWIHYDSILKLVGKKDQLRKAIERLYLKDKDNQAQLVAEVKALRKKAKFIAKGLKADIVKLQTEVDMISTQLPEQLNKY